MLAGIPTTDDQLMMFDLPAPADERRVGRWTLRAGVPLEADQQDRHHRKAERPDWPFAQMAVGECFDARPEEVGEEDLLRAANVVSSAASGHKKREAQKGNTVDFKTKQIGGRFVRCWRIA